MKAGYTTIRGLQDRICRTSRGGGGILSLVHVSYHARFEMLLIGTKHSPLAHGMDKPTDLKWDRMVKIVTTGRRR